MKIHCLLLALPLIISTNILAKESIGLGSGYTDLENTIINYEYNDFGGFYLRIGDEKITWQGFVGYFKGITSVVEPQLSKITDGIYFASWPTRPGHGDNVIWNFNDKTVFAHLGGGNAFKLIHGTIYCRNTPACKSPPQQGMSRNELVKRLVENVTALGFRSPVEALAPSRDMGLADIEGMNTLKGKTLVYNTPQGKVQVDFDGQKLYVKETENEKQSYASHATLVAKDIYFVSWGGAHGGSHIIFNANTMKVFDHIQNDGKRMETIYTASCFLAKGKC